MLLKTIEFFIAYISNLKFKELIFIAFLLFIFLIVSFRRHWGGKKRLVLLTSTSLYASLLLELTILNREPRILAYSDNDFFLTIKMLLWDSKESQMYPDIIGNIVLFVPCGILMELLLKIEFFSVLIGFLVTFSIETVQLLTGRGLFEVSDLLFNTLGVVIGVWLYKTFKKRSERTATNI